MIEVSHKTAATVALAPEAALNFAELPAIASWLLRQSDVTVQALDIGLAGDTLEYSTDHGTITLTMRVSEDGTRQVALLCNTLVRGSRESGRQMCYQLVRRLIARSHVASVYWGPTRQRLNARDFVWGRLGDAPQRLARARIVPVWSVPLRTSLSGMRS